MTETSLNKWVDTWEEKSAIPSQAARSTLIGKLKFGIIFSVLCLIVAVVIWPLTDAGKKGFKLNFEDGAHSSTGTEAKMIEPRFHGVDKDNQPYTITASEALRKSEDNLLLQNINADISLNNGAWLSLLSKRGDYNMKGKIVNLEGSVNLFLDNGYEVLTETALVMLDQSEVIGNTEVVLQGPLGTLMANAFKIQKNGDELLFHGEVHLVVHP